MIMYLLNPIGKKLLAHWTLMRHTCPLNSRREIWRAKIKEGLLTSVTFLSSIGQRDSRMWLPVKDKWFSLNFPNMKKGSMMSSRPLRILEAVYSHWNIFRCFHTMAWGCQLWAEKGLCSHIAWQVQGSRDSVEGKQVYGKHLPIGNHNWGLGF